MRNEELINDRINHINEMLTVSRSELGEIDMCTFNNLLVINLQSSAAVMTGNIIPFVKMIRLSKVMTSLLKKEVF